MIKRTLLRILAIAVIAGGLLLALGGNASAGRVCAYGRDMPSPLPDFRWCVPTYPS